MPRRKDIRKVLVLGSGPIVIGQACEFDYSGTQAVKALREEGIEVVLCNSNPATIMTDPELSERTYVEPLTAPLIAQIIERERPQAILPTVGGQTALNLAVELWETGVLERSGVELIGAKIEAIKVAEDRKLFKACMERAGLVVPKGGFATTWDEARDVVAGIDYPVIIRPSFTLGGAGGGIAYNVEELEEIVRSGLTLSPIRQILIEESVLGWKEFELEVMRDLADNVVVICSIENLDPMGVHTGDSITVAPAQTLTDKEYQVMRDWGLRVIRAVGVETGGSNIQFAIHPDDGRIVVIEMNPRVSRSSALASKATGFPIAKIAAKLALGYTLDELPNDITRETKASFEPTIDYVVVKIPRFNFEKFPGADPTLTTSMKSVGEAMAIGRTFKEALQKGLRSMEVGRFGLGGDGKDSVDPRLLHEKLVTPNPDRIFYIRYALQSGMTVGNVAELTRIDPWFLGQIEQIVTLEGKLRAFGLSDVPVELLRTAKRFGFSDVQLAHLLRATEAEVRARRKGEGISVTMKAVDTCAAEFEAFTPYFYSTYESEDESRVSAARKVVILGGGPNRIGQGIEFDYCCCHAAFALREMGVEAVMINCNPETVSTDYDTSARLYFEPLTFEDVMNVLDVEQPEGVILQFGGQTPLRLALPLHRAGVNILGTSPDSIDLAEDRERFSGFLEKLGIPQPEHGTARSVDDAVRIAREIGYPVLLRPSYVLGGRGMQIVYDEAMLLAHLRDALEASQEHPVLIDRFLEDAFELDVDCVGDGHDVVIGGIMQHIEEAGIHSGDSACVLPPYWVTASDQDVIREHTFRIAKGLKVTGLMNAQFAIKDRKIYVLEVNPRASRTVPFVSKATQIPLAKVATRVMMGMKLQDAGLSRERKLENYYVKEVALPFARFPGVDTVLGPEMRSTGEGMGVSDNFGHAFAKAQLSCGGSLPTKGAVFISVNRFDKGNAVPVARGLHELGFQILATRGTAQAFEEAGVPCKRVFKVNEGRPNVVDFLKNGKIDLVVNTPLGRESHHDEAAIRKTAMMHGVACITTLSGAMAAVSGIRALQRADLTVKSLQEYAANP
ncbi:MAG: carbamoyl-phosphate synthase large subunit [Acidobacteriota bacterium]